MSDDPPGPGEAEPMFAATPPAVGRRSARLSRVLADLNHPVATGFLVTIGVIGALLIGSALGPISTVLVYIVLAIFLALGMDPIVNRIQQRGLKRGWAIAIVFGSSLLLVLAFVLILLPPLLAQITELVQSVPAAIASIPDSPWFVQLDPDDQAAVLSALEQFANWLAAPSTIATVSGGVLAAGVGFVSGLSATFIVVALTLYFLGSLNASKRALYALAPARNRPQLQDITERITDSVGRAVIGAVVLSSLNASAVLVLHLLIGLPYAALMAAIAFVITLIPLFGSVIFLVFSTIVALFSSPLQALILGLAYLVYIQLESYVISPRIMNQAVSVPAALVLIGALAGGALMGVVGVIVALPVMASFLLIIREVIVPRQNLKT